MDYDVLIIGAGAAGLSAALTLGRCRRRVLLADGGPPRNAASPAVHNFLSRDGIRPAELLRLGHAQLQPYPTVEVADLRIEKITLHHGSFRATGRHPSTDARRSLSARRILLATGVADVLPPLPGFRDLWGTGVLHCPYCHGWEVRDQPLAVYGRGRPVVGLAALVSRWSQDVVVVTDGPGHLSTHLRRRLRCLGIAVRDEKIARLVGNADGSLRCVEFENGDYLERHALFLTAAQEQRSGLAAALGVRFNGRGAVWVDKNQQTSVPGIHAAGDTTPGQQQALVAAAQGNQAAICVNESLTREECAK